MMQKFKSHKIVEAVKIKAIIHEAAACMIVPEGGADNIRVSLDYMDRHRPKDGGYYVRYPDGYESFSPAQAFEGGYTAVNDAYPTPVETLTTGQPKITGYRNLSPDEIGLMNKIKARGADIEALLLLVREHLDGQVDEADRKKDDHEGARLEAAEPYRWAAMAKTDFQTGLMKLTRAVAQPTTF